MPGDQIRVITISDDLKAKFLSFSVSGCPEIGRCLKPVLIQHINLVHENQSASQPHKVGKTPNIHFRIL